MCCDNYMSKDDHDKDHAGQCPECDCDVDDDGMCCEINHCSYSPVDCELCGYRPCDGSC